MANYGTSLEERLLPSVARLHELRDVIAQSMRVALPGVVQSFTPGPPATVTVLIATNEYVLASLDDEDPVNLSTKAMQLPLLNDVPILIPSAGSYSLTFPIQEGDECLVIFSDTALDVWLQNGGTDNNPISQRRHSLSDAIAVFGLRSTKKALTNYSTTSAQLRSDDEVTIIDLADTGITVTANSVTVNSNGAVAVNGGTVNVTGSTVCNISASGNTKIEGQNFLAHIHEGVTSGTGNSGPVFI